MTKTTSNKNTLKNAVINQSITLADLPRIDDFTFAYVAEDGSVVKIKVTAANMEGTKTTPAFNLNDAVAAYEQKVLDRAEKAAQKAIEREAAKAAKAASTDEE